MLENDLSPPTNPTTVYLKDYQKPDFLVPSITLAVNLADQSSRVIARMKFVRQGDLAAPLVLDGEKMSLVTICLNNKELQAQDYLLDAEKLVINDVPDQFELEIHTDLTPHLNTELSGLYRSSGNYCTQCEAEGFRRITYFPDRPDVLSEYKVTVTAEKTSCPVLLSNGNQTASGEHEDGTHWVSWHDPHPKPSYLFALVAGDLMCISDEFETVSGRSVNLNIYTQAHNIDKCQHAMDSLKHAMRWDEQVYGREYDLNLYNIVAVDDFNMGAMENKGLNIFNSKYVLANQDTATDTDYEGIESVIAHEYFHNWSGNRVTCRDWFQLSLKEGFTVFRDQCFSADMGSAGVKRIQDVQGLRAYQFKEDAGPMAHPVRPESYQEINNFYTATIYNKGAEVIRMMHRLLGETGFRKGSDLYFDSFDGQAVTTEDFVCSMEQANQIDLQQFRLWYTQSGTPLVTIQQDFNDGVLTLTASQSCPSTPGQKNKEAFQIPLSMALFDVTGNKLNEQTLVLDQEVKRFEFDGLDSQPIVSMLRDFSAPIKLEYQQSDEELVALIEFDDNGFARWEAWQRLSLNLILPALKSGDVDQQGYQRLLSALRGLIESDPQDKAIFAEMLTLPSASYIAELSQSISPQTIVAVREECMRRIARDLESEFHRLYALNNHRTEFSLDSDVLAERALKNRALDYLVATGQVAYHALASHQYHSATNMTDRLAAFRTLVHSNYPERSELLGHFYEQWKDDGLVLDKWFAIQAMVPGAATLENVAELIQHPAFSINNPNKVRALLGAFASNLGSFHLENGLAYQFLADQALELNKINPQVAARLVGVFNNWRDYSEPYKSAMQAQLVRLEGQADLAKDVTEIVKKALA